MKKWSFNFSSLINKNNPLSFFVNILIILCILIFFYSRGFEEKFNLRYSDYLAGKKYQQATKKSDENFIIVEIDNKSFNWLAKSFGSMRISIAKLMHALKGNNPKCVVINFLFYGKGLSVEDIYLTAAANSKYPIFFKAELTDDGDYFTPLDAFSSLDPKFGFFKTIPSKDDVSREILLRTPIKGFGTEHDLSYKIAKLTSPSLTQKYKMQDNPKKLINVKGFSYTTPIQYTVLKKNVSIIQAVDLINKNYPKDFFKDKIVIIDGTASVFQNKVLTPLGTLPESLVLINAIKTHSTGSKSLVINSYTVTIIILLLTALIFFLINYSGSFFVFLISSFSGITLSIFLMENLYFKGYILPYGSIALAIIIPGIYSWIQKYLHLSIQSSRLIKLASVEPLTGLYTFKYFSFLLQRAFIKQKRKKKKGFLLVAGIEFFEKESLKSLSFSEENAPFLRSIGTCIKEFYSHTKIFGFSGDINHCYIAFQKYSLSKQREILEDLREHLIGVLMQHDLPYDIRIASVDIQTCNAPSSFSLIQIIQNMLQQKIKPGQSILEFQHSALTKSFAMDSGESLPENDLLYLTTQIHEDRKDLELMKQRLTQSVREYSMAQKLTAMGQLSSYYAHELKNPINNLINCFEILDDPEESEEEKEEIKKLMKQELTRMVDLSKSMGSHFKPSNEKPEEINLNDIISSTLKFLSRKLSVVSIDPIQELDPSLPPLFLVPDQMKQVFLNLFLNAIDAMPDGGHLMVSSFFIPPVVKITVADTGHGIHSIDLERIFEAFYTTKKQEGTGLGLFACYNIIQHHGGKLRAESTPDKGTTFEIILPT